MRSLLLLALLATPFLPAATAQEGMEAGNATGEAPDADESVEGPAGWGFGGAVLLGSLLVAGALAYVLMRQSRKRPPYMR